MRGQPAEEISEASATCIAEAISRIRQARDIAIVSIHWGSNWGYEIPGEQRLFARTLIDKADVSIVHGHSSHMRRASRSIAIDRSCIMGDFLNDYEGIGGYEKYRDDLILMYFADIDRARGDLVALEIVPLQIRKFRLIHPSPQDVDWIRRTLEREGRTLATCTITMSGRRLALLWPSEPSAEPRGSSVTNA